MQRYLIEYRGIRHYFVYKRHSVMPKLTERQTNVLRLCAEYAKENGWAISTKEVQDTLKMNYHTVVNCMMRLQDKGYIEYKGSRQIKVLFLP